MTQSLQLSRQEAARELLKRRQARRSLLDFTEYTFPRYDRAPHHELIASKLEAVARGEIKRLMVNMPPRHGKSELASKRFPAWFVGNAPDKQLITASYSHDLASGFGREVRNIVQSPEYAALFPNSGLAHDSKAADRWHTDQGGVYIATGVGGSITGRGADVFLIDDPLKDDEEAQSERIRDKIWAWYQTVAYTRLMPGGSIVVIQTRWHEDDLSGRLLEEMANGGDQWEILSLPAISDEGEALWPDRYPIDALRQIQRGMDSRYFSALYQQKPTPDEGDYFKREWFRYYDRLPTELRYYGASDYAVTAKGGDYTVHAIVGVDPSDNMYVVDMWRGQTDSDVWVESFLDMAAQFKPMLWAEEQGQIIKSIGPFIDRRQRERGVYLRREQFASVSDKPTRSRSFQARMSMGRVFFPKRAQWLPELEAELLTFPVGKHDDQVDALGLIGRILDEIVPAARAKQKPTRTSDRWDRAFRKAEEDSSWKTA